MPILSSVLENVFFLFKSKDAIRDLMEIRGTNLEKCMKGTYRTVARPKNWCSFTVCIVCHCSEGSYLGESKNIITTPIALNWVWLNLSLNHKEPSFPLFLDQKLTFYSPNLPPTFRSSFQQLKTLKWLLTRNSAVHFSNFSRYRLLNLSLF